ncbi:hypothetical protein O181_055970 [Austropuccinia psidii MF-1]|uniref:Uncharacterized protein n=1 Tax=Austropuccinia psidii MF-1 TaxID=1389203 RepID=A0A9Q3E5B4_9BASI|nr:hypothetical protein [Austropuccinia psidii MF-1]
MQDVICLGYLCSRPFGQVDFHLNELPQLFGAPGHLGRWMTRRRQRPVEGVGLLRLRPTDEIIKKLACVGDRVLLDGLETWPVLIIYLAIVSPSATKASHQARLACASSGGSGKRCSVPSMAAIQRRLIRQQIKHSRRHQLNIPGDSSLIETAERSRHPPTMTGHSWEPSMAGQAAFFVDWLIGRRGGLAMLIAGLFEAFLELMHGSCQSVLPLRLRRFSTEIALGSTPEYCVIFEQGQSSLGSFLESTSWRAESLNSYRSLPSIPACSVGQFISTFFTNNQLLVALDDIQVASFSLHKHKTATRSQRKIWP